MDTSEAMSAGDDRASLLPKERSLHCAHGLSGIVLASLPWAGAAYHLFDVPRAFWEEQFGMVLAEAMAAGLDIVTTTSGAIPEVLAGTDARLVAPGDWMGISPRACIFGFVWMHSETSLSSADPLVQRSASRLADMAVRAPFRKFKEWLQHGG